MTIIPSRWRPLGHGAPQALLHQTGHDALLTLRHTTLNLLLLDLMARLGMLVKFSGISLTFRLSLMVTVLPQSMNLTVMSTRGVITGK